jgi:hypothetical protein
MIDLGYVLRRAWQITRRHKILWLFSFLVSLGTVGKFLSSGSNSRWEQIARELPPDAQRVALDFISSPYFVAVLVLLVMLGIVVSLGLAILGALGRAAVVDQVQAAENQGTVSLHAGWQAGQRHVWSVFFLRLLLGLPAAGVTLAGVLPVVGMLFLISNQERLEVVIPGVLATELAIFTWLFPAICLAVLLSIPLNVLQRLAIRACVLEQRGIRASIVEAWTMLRENLGQLSLVWLVTVIVGGGALVLLGLPLALVTLSFLTVALLTTLISPLLFTGLTLLIGLSAWLVGAAINSVVETFTSTVWTLAYRELTGMGLTGAETTPTT